MKNGVISLGEALIDFIPTDSTNTIYQKSPGGAPANVSVGLARLGVKAAFLGKVGDDVLGRFLEDTLSNYGVDTSFMKFSKDVRTGVVFVTLDESGERSFDFYINPSADRFLEETDLDQSLFKDHKILHIGSISMIDNPVKQATERAVFLAKQHGMLVSYDPNLRLGLWHTEGQARETINSMIPKADILKISEEELAFLSKRESISEGTKWLERFQVPITFITLGSGGSMVVLDKESIHIPAMTVKAVDTTGAGDAFVSGILYCLNKREADFQSLSLEEATQMAQFASISGGLAATVKGAMTALPDIETINKKLDYYK